MNALLCRLLHRTRPPEKGSFRGFLRLLRNTRRITRNPLLRSTLRQFDADAYRDIHPDVSASGLDPLEHMLRYGLNENRSLVKSNEESLSPAPNGEASAGAGIADPGAEVLVLACSAKPSIAVQDFAKDLVEQFRLLDYSTVVITEGRAPSDSWQGLVADKRSGPGAANAKSLDAKDLGLAAWLQAHWASVSCIIAVDEQASVWARLLAPSFPNIGAVLQIRGSASEGGAGAHARVIIHEWVNDSWAVREQGSRFPCEEGLATRMLALGRGRPNNASHQALALGLPAPPADFRDVVVFPIIDWNYRRARPQNFSSALARRGCRVFFLGGRSYLGPRPVVRFQDSPEPNVYQCSLESPVDALAMHDRRASEDQLESMELSLKAFLQDHDIVNPVFLIQHPFWEPLIHRLPKALIVYDIADRLDELQKPGWDFDQNHWNLVEQADQLLVSADLIRADITGRTTGPVTVVRNASTQRILAEPRPTRDQTMRPRVGYVGSLSFWFDAPLLSDVALQRPEYDFLIYGAPEEPAASVLREAANVQLLGEIHHGEVPSRLVELDVGVIPFVRSRLIDATNPVKAYEYLAAGLPVVASPMPEMDNFPAADVWVAQTPGAFALCLDQALQSDAGDVARRRGWASGQTWANRVEQVRWLWDRSTAGP